MLIVAHVSESQSSRPFMVRRPEVSLPVMPTSERRVCPRTVSVPEMEAVDDDI